MFTRRADKMPIASGGKILVMDDEEALRSLLARMLEHLGFSLDVCGNGEEAVDHFKREFHSGRPYAAVILDIVVADGMDGVMAAEKIRCIDPQAKLIASTGFGECLVLKKPTMYGFNGLLQKPYTLADLKNLLSTLLS